MKPQPGACGVPDSESRSLSPVDFLNRSTRILSKSVSTENILAWNCSNKKTPPLRDTVGPRRGARTLEYKGLAFAASFTFEGVCARLRVQLEIAFFV